MSLLRIWPSRTDFFLLRLEKSAAAAASQQTKTKVRGDYIGVIFLMQNQHHR